jgi:predicted HicB family RNase H-like nuclease
MAKTEAQRAANRRYMAKAYDRIELLVSKGDKGKLKAHATKQDESLNGFIKRAINETVQRDGGEPLQAVNKRTENEADD